MQGTPGLIRLSLRTRGHERIIAVLPTSSMRVHNVLRPWSERNFAGCSSVDEAGRGGANSILVVDADFVTCTN